LEHERVSYFDKRARDFLIVKELGKKNVMRTFTSRKVELNTSSVADIAFLLLSFFLMTTVINTDKGLTLTLPEWRDQPIKRDVLQRNLFKIHLNSANDLMVEGERLPSLEGLRHRVRAFILNNGADPNLSTDPTSAIVSLKTDRGTTQQAFITALDEIQAAYYSIYAERAGMSVEKYRALNIHHPSDQALIEKAKAGIPMNISLAD
jgi:biopolymer transport protein ExbD